MADLRRIVLALAVVALFAGLANAQMNCTTTSTPPLLRSEGITDIAGDILLSCAGGTATPYGQAIPQQNFTIYMSTTVTSRLLNSSNVSEALLLVNDPGSTLGNFGNNLPIVPCPSASSGCTATAGVTTYNSATVEQAQSSGVVYNAFFGIVSGSSVTFNGVPVLAPGSFGYTTTFRFTNIRVNSSAVGVGTLPTPVTAEISFSNPGAFSVSTSFVTVGYVVQSLKTSLRSNLDGTLSSSAQNLLQCQTSGGMVAPGSASTVSPSTTTPVVFTYLRYSEQFATAFKTRVSPSVPGATSGQSAAAQQNLPGTIYSSESDFTPYASGVAVNYTGTSVTPGLADFGTRLAAVFSNIPAGVSIYVPITSAYGSGTTTVVLVPSATYLYGSGALVGVPSTTTSVTTAGGSSISLASLPISSGAATAVWEVTTTSPSAIENLDVPVFLLYTSNTSTNTPGLGTTTVNLRYAPVATDIGSSTITAASSSQPIPRFLDTSTAATFFATIQCTTTLLFPYVTEIAGFDTGFAVANTSSDPFGTTAQAGVCTLYWYGTAAPANYTTPSVPAGTIWAGLASILAPGFNGYMIMTCNFQYAHGFAFVSDLGARNLAMGYLPLIMNNSSGVYRPTPTGESLNQ